MNLIKSVRTNLGISQAMLAGILGVSLSLLKQAETNRRPLPPEARQHLAALYDFIAGLPTSIPEVPGMDPEWKKKQIRNLRARLAPLLLALEQWETRNQQALLRLLLAAWLKGGTSPIPTAPLLTNLDLMVYETENTLDPKSQTPYWELKLKIVALENRINYLREL